MDGWLRETLAPSPSQVRRVVRHAVQAGAAPAPPARPLWRLPAAAAALLALALAFVALALRERAPGEPPEKVRYGADVAVATITNRSGDVELLLPPGWEPPQPAEGAVPEGLKLFNSDGCMAAVLPEGDVRYYIVGGDT